MFSIWGWIVNDARRRKFHRHNQIGPLTFCAAQFEYVIANGIGFVEGNVIKYVSRWQFKNGLEDLRKAHHMLGVLIASEEAKQEKK